MFSLRKASKDCQSEHVGIWHVPIIPALRRLRRKYFKLEASLNYSEFKISQRCLLRPLKTKTTTTKKKKTKCLDRAVS